MKKMVKGEITVFLSMIFLLLLTLVGAVIESASIQVLKNEKRAAAGRAVESVFAEFQTTLLENYDIFAVEGTYETGHWSEENILNRLAFYGAENMDSEIKKIEYLSDHSGQAFYQQAVEYEKEKYGVDVAESLAGGLSVWKDQKENAEEYEKENTRTSAELDTLLNEAEEKLPEEDNPIEAVGKIRNGKMLDIVLPQSFVVSQKAVDASGMVSRRSLNTGRGSFPEHTNKIPSSIFFNLYLLDKFICASDESNNRPLEYELEYLLEGKANDSENLESVVKKLLLLRFGPNYGYLCTDTAKKAEAETLAAGLCTLLTVPGVTEIVKQAILLAWAYGEGIMDVRSLLSGRRVPLIKSKESWQLPLTGLLTLGASGDINEGKDWEGGYTYQRYLQMLLLLEKKELLTMRALDLIETNLRTRLGKDFFRVDTCITKLETKNRCSMRRGITYNFKTRFMYQ